jgi:hypothetical protein
MFSSYSTQNPESHWIAIKTASEQDAHGYIQPRAGLVGWRDLLKWGICVRPGMGP